MNGDCGQRSAVSRQRSAVSKSADRSAITNKNMLRRGAGLRLTPSPRLRRGPLPLLGDEIFGRQQRRPTRQRRPDIIRPRTGTAGVIYCNGKINTRSCSGRRPRRPRINPPGVIYCNGKINTPTCRGRRPRRPANKHCGRDLL